MHFLQALAAFSRCTAFPRNQAVWARLQHCSLHPFRPGLPFLTPNLPQLLPCHSLCPPLQTAPVPLELCPSQHLWGIFSLNRLIDIAGGRWTDTQTPFPGNQPENPQVDSHTTIPNPCQSFQPECSPVSKALGSLCLRYDVLGSKPSLISFKRFTKIEKRKKKQLVFYKSESLGQREARGVSLNNGLPVPVLPELLGSADSPFILSLWRSFLSQAQVRPHCATSPAEVFQENNELWAWSIHLF